MSGRTMRMWAVVWAGLVAVAAGSAWLASTAKVEGPEAAGETCIVPPVTAEGAPGLFDTGGFPRRWDCGVWPAELGWMHIVGDVMVWGAYMAIPIVLAAFVRGRRDLPFPMVFWLFIAFIACCGFGHLIEAGMFWWPAYRFSGSVKVLTAVVSWLTVASLVPLLPKALRVPSLVRDNEELRSNLRERERMQSELGRSNELLAHRTREMEHMIYAVSHDLKSPVFTIVSVLELLRRDIEKGRVDRAQELMSSVVATSHRLRDTIGDLLEFARIGRVALEFGPVDLGALAHRLVGQHGPRIEEMGARVQVRGDLPVVRGDAKHIEQAMDNLLTNALKFTCPGRRCEVTIRGETVGDVSRVVVEDNGPGIPSEHREKVFGLFERLDGSTEGTGVGLALVRRVVEVHGGRAWVEGAPGGGARFVLEFPRDVEGRGGGVVTA